MGTRQRSPYREFLVSTIESLECKAYGTLRLAPLGEEPARLPRNSAGKKIEILTPVSSSSTPASSSDSWLVTRFTRTTFSHEISAATLSVTVYESKEALSDIFIFISTSASGMSCKFYDRQYFNRCLNYVVQENSLYLDGKTNLHLTENLLTNCSVHPPCSVDTEEPEPKLLPLLWLFPARSTRFQDFRKL